MRRPAKDGGARAVLGIEMGLVTLALLFGLSEATGTLGESNIIWNMTNIVWPLSMVFMLVSAWCPPVRRSGAVCVAISTTASAPLLPLKR